MVIKVALTDLRHLLYFPVVGYGLVGVPLHLEPRPHRLEAPVGAAPAGVIDPVLQVVVVLVAALHDGCLALGRV